MYNFSARAYDGRYCGYLEVKVDAVNEPPAITGLLTFAGPPDYESPTDSGRDNVYEVTVEARDDSFNTGALQITITVVNLTVFTGPACH